MITKTSEQSEATEQREQELEDEVERVIEKRMAEEPDTTESRQAVVEADHDAQRVDGVGQHALAEEGQHGVEDRGANARGEAWRRSVLDALGAAWQKRGASPCMHPSRARFAMVGRIVVIRLAAEDASTARYRGEVERMAKDRYGKVAEDIVGGLLDCARPIPVSPSPANIWVATATSR